MGIPTGQHVHARDRNGQVGPHDPAQTRPATSSRAKRVFAGLIFCAFAFPAGAENFRIATYNVSLGRKGPGLLLRDITRGDPQVEAVAQVIAKMQPDILLLNDFDYDFRGVTLRAFSERIEQAGWHYSYRFALAPNSGVQTGLDIDGDGRENGPGDAHGFGFFEGQQGMAILSRFPIDEAKVRDFSKQIWPRYPLQRLSSKGHWDVPVTMPGGWTLHLLASHVSPPVFDDEMDRNGLRNRDEIAFWIDYLDTWRPIDPLVLIGDMNADPNDGEGSHAVIRALLDHPLLQDPEPESRGAIFAAEKQGEGNANHVSPAKFDTVDWDEARTPGNMRVDYVLPSASLEISGAGVFWPAPDEEGYELLGSSGDVSSHHRLVWVDITR